MANKIDRLSFVRKRLTQDIERQLQNIDECQADTEPTVLLSRKDALEELWADFRSNTKELENSQNWVGDDKFIEENALVHEQYLKGVAQITELLPTEASMLQQSFVLFQRHPRGTEPIYEEQGANSTAHNMHSSTPTGSAPPPVNGLSATIKLPALQIKPFSGQLLDWPEFKATVESISIEITDEINKFQYLKSFLTDEPAQMIKHLPFWTDSYERAWTILKKRYENERAIINASLKRVVDPEIRTFGSAEALKTMVNAINECIATVTNYGINIDTWDSIMIVALTRHLDTHNIHHWETQMKGRKTIPKLSEFISFLEMRINILETTVATKSMVAHNSRD